MLLVGVDGNDNVFAQIQRYGRVYSFNRINHVENEFQFFLGYKTHC